MIWSDLSSIRRQFYQRHPNKIAHFMASSHLFLYAVIHPLAYLIFFSKQQRDSLLNILGLFCNNIVVVKRNMQYVSKHTV